jgi:hypothetical protein
MLVVIVLSVVELIVIVLSVFKLFFIVLSILLVILREMALVCLGIKWTL